MFSIFLATPQICGINNADLKNNFGGTDLTRKFVIIELKTQNHLFDLNIIFAGI